MSEDKIKQLMREGIEAARANDKATARDRFEQVTDLDENNERAWYYMAQVVETDEEKRVCLNNVLVINPSNEKAQQLLDRLDRRRQEQAVQEEILPGISRQHLRLIVGGGAAVVVVLILLLVLIASSNASRTAEEQRVATAAVQQSTDIASSATAVAMAANETRVAQGGTDTPTPRTNELPPTFTPSPPPSETPTQEMAPLPDPSVPGDLAIFGGQDILSNGALELYLLPANGLGERQRIGTELGREVRFADSGTRVVYTRYFDTTLDFGMEAININGTQPQLIRSTQGVIKARQPDHCRTANQVAFVAISQDVPTSNEDLDFDADPPIQLYVLNLDQSAVPTETNEQGTPLPDNATRRLTNDSATYSQPAFSPDCSRIAVVKDDLRSATPGTDIVIIEVNNPSNVTRVTTDLTTFTEFAPRWTADGSQLVFAAAQATDLDNHDIVLVNADGSGAPLLLVKHEADDIYPVISPDGQYLAFSSNRQGAYNIFIQRLADGQLWQLTNETNDVFVGDWWQ